MGEAKRRAEAAEAEAAQVVHGIEREAEGLGTYLGFRRAAGVQGGVLLAALMDAVAAEWVSLSIEASGAVPTRREIGSVLVMLSGLVEDACLAASVQRFVPEPVVLEAE